MGDRSIWRGMTAIGLCCALALPAPIAARADEEQAQHAAEQIRQQHGLVKITGRVWGLPLEEQLRSRLKRLPDLRERIVTCQKELDERLARNDLAWQQAAPLIEALRKQIATLSTSDPQRGILAEQLARLEAEVVPPAALAGRDAIRTLLARLGQDRCLLALDLIWIRSTAGSIAERYRQLAGDEELVRLIKQSGDRCRLGPARNYAAEVRRLDEYDKLVITPQAPLYLQSGRVRVTAIVSDAICVTFSWSEASDAVTFLPASTLRSAGIEVPADAPREMLRIEGRQIEARAVFLPSLRLGSCHARSVAAYILPPEAEDLGAQLTPLSLSPWRAKVERERLRLVLSE